jgi:hypothetical protein
MHSAPYIIVGYNLAPGVDDADVIIRDLDTQMPLASTRFCSWSAPRNLIVANGD